MPCVFARLLVAGALVALVQAPARAQTGDNVAVVINDASPASQRIGEYYARKRSVPAENVIHISAPTTDEITKAAYDAAIQNAIAGAIVKHDLQDRILYIVLTKGIPLRIQGTSGQDGTVASVDSELTLLYRRLTGRLVATAGPVQNPYFLGNAPVTDARPFSHAQHDIYLVTRLDAFTVDEAIRLIDRASGPAATGRIVLDEKATLFNRIGEDWLDEAAKRLKAMGNENRVLLDTSTKGVRDVDNVMGYYSWGSNDPDNRVRKFGLGFVPGAIAATYVSSDARTFEEPPAAWQPTENWNDKQTWFAGSPQTLSGDLIREGATGVAGQVAEPYLGATIRPQILFPAYVSGFNLAESFYLSIPMLSWQTVVVGDPLCRPVKPEVTLTRADLDVPIDPATTLPKYFSARGFDIVRVQFGLTNPAQIALALRSQAERARGNRAAMQKSLTELTDANPSVIPAQMQLAELLNTQGDYDSAVQRYRLVLKQQPKNAIGLNNLAYLLAVQKNNPQEAKPLADEALRLLPREPTVLDTAGWVQYLLGDYDGASKLLARAVAGAARNPDVHLHAAFAYAAAGAKAAALTELDAAVKLDPKLSNRDDVKGLRKKLEGSPADLDEVRWAAPER
jgi:uncharacterized protein (TIGR03790 family)